MPSVINGCGTWYYTRGNVHSREGVCKNCGRAAVLTSYDTRLFVVLVFIPIIPLGRKRIVDQCAACRRHGVIPWASWQEAMARGRKVVGAYLRAPANRDLAIEAIQTCASFRDAQEFVPLAVQIEKSLPRDVQVMAMTAAVFDLFNMSSDAERVLRTSLELNDNDDTSEALADVLLKQGRPDEAVPCLEHIVTRRLADRTGSLFALAQGFQLKGMHENALQVFAKCEEINPRYAQDKVFVKLKAESTKRLGTNKPIKPGKLLRSQAVRETRGKILKVAAVLAPLALLIYLGISFYQGGHEKIYLLSGMDKPYTVAINGVSYTLQPWSQMPAEAREGVNRLHFVNPALPMPDENFTAHVSFWTRPFSSTAVVVNPDRSAIVDRTTVYYRPEGMPGRDADVELHAGQLVESYPGIDYPFEVPPESMDMGQSSEIAKKCLRLIDRKDRTTPSLLDAMQGNGKISVADLTQACRQRVCLDPDDEESRQTLEQNLPKPELLGFLNAGLSFRPLVIDWHREYQSLLQQDGKNDELIALYRDVLAKEPENPDMMYLLSRVLKDPDESLALLHSATTAPKPSAYAFYSLAGSMLENGEFQQALDAARAAVRLRPESQEFKGLRDQSLIADGRVQDVLDQATKAEGGPLLTSIGAYEAELTCYALLQQRASADAVCARFSASAKKENVPELDVLMGQTPGDVAYMFGDPAGLKVGVSATSDADLRFPADVSNGAVADAEKDLQQMPHTQAMGYLDLYLAAMQAGNAEIAKRSIQTAIDKLSKGTIEDREYAVALGGTSTLTVEKLFKLRHPVPEKVLLLTALGLRQPPMRSAAFALAEKLNFNPRFPHLLIAAAIAGR